MASKLGLTLVLLLLLDRVGAQEIVQRAIEPKAGASGTANSGRLAEDMFAAFDTNGDGSVDRTEAAAALPQLTSPEDRQHGTDEERFENFWMMLDEDGDGRGSRAEFSSFVKKMVEMDGRVDRLPASSGKQSGRTRRGRRRPTTTASTVPTADHDEL